MDNKLERERDKSKGPKLISVPETKLFVSVLFSVSLL